MCGIAGIILQPHTQLPDLAERLGCMAQAMAHRGPDDQGVTVTADGRVGFANRRLAIRDLSPAGHMPSTAAGQDLTNRLGITASDWAYSSAISTQSSSQLSPLGAAATRQANPRSFALIQSIIRITSCKLCLIPYSKSKT